MTALLTSVVSKNLEFFQNNLPENKPQTKLKNEHSVSFVKLINKELKV